ncbi:UDP-glycosyltransferase 89B2 [Ricinus communis]|uniref:Glycosyltransferase n=1 Tax=Ricinus communis TaxID=3988 RepID=B9RLH6_RICCO|nr:UDP-glycosyltransferase 89B2 [Ricinus communis]EEF47701.1 UDP-glucosyltransferase, putative [Ricinus communis]|eukprot:XP_002514595.1 UDP-glycosyltransferase 89B2 [Ricinus communis]
MTILAPEAETHILVFPFPAQGHMIPLLDLTRKLAVHGLTITILVTPKNLSFLHPLLSTHPSIETLVFPFPAHPLIPSGVENNKDLPAECTPVLIRALGGLYDPLLHWFISHPSPPVAIISDMFLGWTQNLASQLNIRRIVFSPSGAMALSIIYSLWRDMPRRNQNEVVSFSRIPNCPNYPWRQISPIYRSYIENDTNWEFIKDSFRANLVSWGLVVNSFTELEEIYLDYFKKELGSDHVWAVGPLLPPHHDSISRQSERGGPSSVPVHDVMAWLDTCEDHRVVYVCFGSQTWLTKDQIEELALSLEMSKVNFIWCVKEHINGKYSVIPSGFEDRVAGRGLVIRGWVPQVLILSHPAVGAFLTHCGWNSVLEGLVAAVPMLAWPMGADQFVNARLLVDELQVAVRVCEGAKTVPNSDELARVIMESVSENRVEREQAKKLRRVAMDTIKDRGRSMKDFDGLVKNLFRLKVEAQ